MLKKEFQVENVDGYCFVIEKTRNSKGIKIYTGYNFVSMTKSKVDRLDCYVATKEGFKAHGETVSKAVKDLQFKIVADKLKKEPITKDTKFTVKYYRLLTGACDFGCRQWLSENKIPFKIEGENTVELKPMKAAELLPLLRKSNAYGLQNIEKLLTF